jgi:hypothetical protein
VGGHANHLASALATGLIFVCALFFLRLLLKRDWLAAVVAALLGIWIEGDVLYSDQWKIQAAIYSLIYLAVLLIVIRLGLVAVISTVFFVNSFNPLVLGLDWSTWYAPYGLATLALLLSIAIFAFWRSLGSRSLFGHEEAGPAH